jgi:hypothetical protein
MKISKLNSVLLVCNLLLLCAGAYFFIQRRPPASDENADSGVQNLTSQTEALPLNSQAPTAPSVITVTNQFRWRQLETEDYRAYIERLRAIGCPEQTIRDIVIADLDKLMAPRIQAIYGRRADLQFWHSEEEELANDRDERDIDRKRRDIDQEKRSVIEELLGVDLVRERMRLRGEQDYYERRLGFLPEQRRGEVRKILEKFDQLQEELRNKEWTDGTPLTAQERAELGRLSQQKQAELAAFLSPAEQQQYELWMSDTANAVRHATYGMDISKEEFLAIYNAHKTFDEQWAARDPGLMDDAAAQRLQAAHQQMESDLERQLGTERFAEYKRGEDPEFHQLAKTATRFNLSKDTAKRVYDVKRTLEEVRQSLEQNPRLTSDQKSAAMHAIHEESQRTVRQLLGEKAFNYYQRTGDVGWLAVNH